MIDESLAFGDTFAHRLDPRVKIVVAALWSVVVALVNDPLTASVALAFAVLLACCSGLPPGRMLGRLLVVNAFVAFLWLVVPFTYPGEPLADWGVLSPTAGGVDLVLLVTLKSNAIVLVLLVLVATTTVPALGRALRSLGVPPRLVFLLVFTWRQVAGIAGEFERLRAAARVRCFRPGTNLHTYRTWANMVGMMLVRSFENAERSLDAMRLRGFDGEYRTLTIQRAGRMDFAFAAIMTAVTVALVVFDLMV
jgi:cobalt/nickel transport system permease protein